MRTAIAILALLVGSSALAALAPDAQAAGTQRLAVFGDTGTSGSTQANVNLALSEGATGYLGLGDYYYSDTVAHWMAMLSPLTSKGHWLALGNHDDYGALVSLMPSGPQWSVDINGARVVAINTEARMDVGSAQYNAVRGELCNAQESVRVLVMHKPWWLLSGALHPGTEFPGSPSAMDAMVRDCKVSLVLSGHEHNYQRMTRNGIAYAIVGTGGESLYPVAGSPSGTVASCSCYGHLVLDLGASGYSAHWETTSGSTRDAWSFTAPTTTPPPPPSTGSATFTGESGNEWWVQVYVSGSPTAVSVRDATANGAWTALVHQSWGAWAKSVHVLPGNAVQFQATLPGGAVATSCVMAHPGGSCVGGGFAATFTNARGNAWWVEADVAATGGTLVGVDASVNGGPWVPLSHTSWGSWAKSISAPAGSQVRFRADASGGATSVSGSYAWPPP